MRIEPINWNDGTNGSDEDCAKMSAISSFSDERIQKVVEQLEVLYTSETSGEPNDESADPVIDGQVVVAELQQIYAERCEAKGVTFDELIDYVLVDMGSAEDLLPTDDELNKFREFVRSFVDGDENAVEPTSVDADCVHG